MQHASDLIGRFRCLDSILNEANQRGRVVTWGDVERAFEAAGHTLGISLHDVDTILEVFPTAYTLSWRRMEASTTPVLCLGLNLQSAGRALNVESRIRQLCSGIDEWYRQRLDDGNNGSGSSSSSSSSAGNDDNDADDTPHLIVHPHTTNIPPMPELSAAASSHASTAGGKVAATVTSIASIALAKRNSTTAGHEHELTGGLDGLRHLAEQRERMKKETESAKLKEKADANMRSRLASLCVVCDALRSKFLTSNRSSLKTAELLHKLSAELSILPRELAARVQLVAAVVPELITVVHPDNVVPYSVVRFNMQALYATARKKLAQYVTSTLATMNGGSV